MIKKYLSKRLAHIIDYRCDAKIRECEQKYLELKSNFDYQTKVFEYKLWQNKCLTNQLFYELLLKDKQKKKNFSPLVSIVIPVYNGSNYLEEAINSALAQTYKNIEVIVINDGSNDGGKTEKIAKKFKNQIRYYKKENGGVSTALNFGLKKMKGEYFAWLSHDDLFEPNHIEKLIEHLSYQGHENDIPFSLFKIIDENGDFNARHTIVAQLYQSDFKLSYLKNELSLLQGEINGDSILLPKKALKKFGGFDENLRISQERNLWSKLIKEYHFINIPFCTTRLRIHKKQVSNTNPNVRKETNKECLRIIDDISEETITRLFGSKEEFLKHLIHFYDLNRNQQMIQQLEKRLGLNTHQSKQ